MATDAQTSPVAQASEPVRPPVSEELERQDWPGVVPSDRAHRPVRASEPDEPDTERRVLPEVIVEVAPPAGEQRPEPGERRREPYEPSEPSEVITEVAPEVIPEVAPEIGPAETERPRDPSEVITEVAPEVAPER